jgi:peptidoglycan/LPS O-acetylase OafA/YrhL
MRHYQLDGVRGLGVLIVVAAHHFIWSRVLLFTGCAWMDLFFALSGFLITRILLQTRERQDYWQQFYIKRVGRILPPLVLLLAVAPLFSPHPDLAGYLGYAFFLGNLIDTTNHGSELFFVLWSLAIEEQFYLLWPVLVRVLTPQRVLRFALAIIVLSPIARHIATPYAANFKPIFYLTCFRMDGLAAGSLLALLPLYPRVLATVRRVSVPMFLLAVAIFLVLLDTHKRTFFWQTNSQLFNTCGYSLVVAGSFFLLAHLISADSSPISRFLAFRPFVFLGEISYGLYLFHMVVLTITRQYFYTGLAWVPQRARLFWIDLPLSILVAWLSYKFIELPILRRCNDKARRLRHRETHYEAPASTQPQSA